MSIEADKYGNTVIQNFQSGEFEIKCMQLYSVGGDLLLRNGKNGEFRDLYAEAPVRLPTKFGFNAKLYSVLRVSEYGIICFQVKLNP